MPVPPVQTHERYERVFAEVEAPFAFVDLEAMWANAEAMLERAAGKPIRVASKSVRCRALLGAILARDPRFQGLMTYTLPETLWLAEQGFENLLLAYPTADVGALEELALRSAANPDGAPIVMVDCVEHLEMIESVLGKGAPPLRVCIDVDASWWWLGGRVKVGPKRSPIHTVEQAVALAREIEKRPQIELDALMAYEGQIAGVGDRPPGRRLRGAAIRFMQKRSVAELAERRGGDRRGAERVRRAGDRQRRRHRQPRADRRRGGGDRGDRRLRLLRARPSSTTTAASASPRRRASRCRSSASPRPGSRPRSAAATSPPAPATRPRLPAPWLPEGLQLDARRGRRRGADAAARPAAAEPLGVGDRVYLRHAKAGELCERFDTLHLVEGDRIVDEVPTYRGEGKAFL